MSIRGNCPYNGCPHTNDSTDDACLECSTGQDILRSGCEPNEDDEDDY